MQQSNLRVQKVCVCVCLKYQSQGEAAETDGRREKEGDRE